MKGKEYLNKVEQEMTGEHAVNEGSEEDIAADEKEQKGTEVYTFKSNIVFCQQLTMPFKKGDVKTIEWAKKGGRPGYRYEQAELERMKKILAKYFTLVEKKELDEKDTKHLERLEKAALKIMDKRHANKTDITSDGKQVFINIASEIAEQNDIK